MCNTEKIMKQYELQKKIRKIWEINPKERIVESKKNYNRKKERQEFQKMLKRAEGWE